jgi:hypothetical protein
VLVAVTPRCPYPTVPSQTGSEDFECVFEDLPQVSCETVTECTSPSACSNVGCTGKLAYAIALRVIDAQGNTIYTHYNIENYAAYVSAGAPMRYLAWPTINWDDSVSSSDGQYLRGGVMFDGIGWAAQSYVSYGPGKPHVKRGPYMNWMYQTVEIAHKAYAFDYPLSTETRTAMPYMRSSGCWPLVLSEMAHSMWHASRDGSGMIKGMWLACLPDVPVGSVVKPVLVPKKPGASALQAPDAATYPQLARCHVVKQPGSSFYSQYAPVESMDGERYGGGGAMVISPRFCTTVGVTHEAAIASYDGIPPTTAYVRMPPTWESSSAGPDTHFVTMYVLDGTRAIVDRISQRLEYRLGLDEVGNGMSPNGVSGSQLFVIGVPVSSASRAEVLSPIATLSTYTNNDRKPFPNDAPRIDGYSSGSSGTRLAAYLVGEVELGLYNLLLNAYGYKWSRTGQTATAARVLIGSGIAASSALYAVRRRMACGSMDAAYLFDAVRWFSIKDLATMTRWSDVDASHINASASNADWQFSLAYTMRLYYGALYMRQTVGRNPVQVNPCDGGGSRPLCDLATFYAGRTDDTTGKVVEKISTAFGVWGEWYDDADDAAIAMHGEINRMLRLNIV